MKRHIKAITEWIKKHKLWAFLIVLLIFVGLEYLSLPSRAEIRNFRKTNPKMTALMEQRRKEAVDKKKGYSIRQQWVPLSRICENLKRAVIVAEDGTFYEHEGIDWYEVKESIKKDIEKGKFVRGASTITQQLGKNLFLSTSKDPIRKLKEVIIATMIEDELTKSRVLELYLNIIEMGDGVFGVDAASVIYFGKHSSELSREEAARIAAVIPSPLRYKPNTESRYVRYRKNIILARMNARGW
ncbi:MAG: monofunctional biosynthetic peptidoglycan transglycosylase [Bacteroidota bacterium]|nr:monofunctional biosynthetic peptidoglycan transglycosylase [Bacteroidota bacterium]